MAIPNVNAAELQTYKLTTAQKDAVDQIKSLVGPRGYVSKTEEMEPHFAACQAFPD